MSISFILCTQILYEGDLKKKKKIIIIVIYRYYLWENYKAIVIEWAIYCSSTDQHQTHQN